MLVERGRLLGSDPEGREHWIGSPHEFPDQGTADATPSPGRLHVDVANSPHRRLSLIRVEVEAAEPYEGPVEVRKERDFPRSVEAVSTGFPLSDKSADEREALTEADLDEPTDLGGELHG